MGRYLGKSVQYGCLVLTVVALAFLASAAWAQEAQPAANPIANADFEGGNAGWRIANGAVVEENPHGGKACLRLDRTEKGGGVAVQFVTLEPDTWYVFEFYYKVTGTPGASQIRFMGERVDGAMTIPSQSYYFDRYATDQWTRGVNHIFSSKGGKCEIEMRVFIFPNTGEEGLPATATLWLDDMVLRPMTSADMKGELIENGGFEAGVPGELPPGWSRQHARLAGLPTVAVCGKEAHSGKQSLRVQMGPAQKVEGRELFVRSSGDRRLPLGRVYTFSYWAKASQNADARVLLLGPAKFDPVLHLTPEWQQFSFEVMVTPEQQAAAKWGPAFAAHINGPLSLGDVTFWYDDFSLVPAGQ